MAREVAGLRSLALPRDNSCHGERNTRRDARADTARHAGGGALAACVICRTVMTPTVPVATRRTRTVGDTTNGYRPIAGRLPPLIQRIASPFRGGPGKAGHGHVSTATPLIAALAATCPKARRSTQHSRLPPSPWARHTALPLPLKSPTGRE